MIWNPLSAVVMTTLFSGVRAAEWNKTRTCFFPMVNYSEGWTATFPRMFSNSTSADVGKSEYFMATEGGNLTVDFVGTGLYVEGYFGIPHTLVNETVHEIRIRVDDADAHTYSNSGPSGKNKHLVFVDGLPDGKHTAQIFSTRGGIAITTFLFTLTVPVSQEVFKDTVRADKWMALGDPLALRSDITTVGQWSAVATSGDSDKRDNPHIRTTSKGGSVTYAMGKGNAMVQVFGNLGADHGPITVEIDPSPYLTPASTDLLPVAPYVIADTTLFVAPLEVKKNYTIKITNTGTNQSAPVLELTSIFMFKTDSVGDADNSGSADKMDKGDSDQEANGNDPTASNGANTSGDKSGSGSGVNAGAVAGGVVGGFAAAAGLAAAIFFYMKRKRQRDWEASRDPGGKLDIDVDDNVTPFMADAPGGNFGSAHFAPSSPYGRNSISTGSQSGASQSGSAYLQPLLGAGPATMAVGALPVKSRLPMDQPAPQVPQDTDAGPMTNDMIPPSYDPSWAGASSSRLSTATSSDFSSHDADAPDYEPNLSSMEELDEPTACSSSRPLPAPVSSWPQDRKDPRDFM